jgi:asparagine synthase (glutamine-hydrolysing)
MMRRALAGLLPIEVVERKRKAFISRAPLRSLRDGRRAIESLFADSETQSSGFIDRNIFIKALDSALSGEGKWISQLTNAIEVELWLRSLN